MRAPVALWDALRHRDFRLFYVGQSVSFVGDTMFFLAMSWQVLELGGTAATLGLVTGAYMLAQVALLLLGGVLVDRFRRRDLILLSDAGQGALAGGLAVLAWQGLLTFPLLVGFALAFGAFSAVAMPAMGAFVPETVPAQVLPSATSLYQGTRSVAQMVGPLIGGLLVAGPGPGAAFGLNALTFLFAVALTLFTRGGPPPAARPWTMGRDVREGARYVAGQPWLWMTILAFGVINIMEAGPRNVALPVFVSGDLGMGAAAYGLVLAASAAGGLVGFVVVGSLPPLKHRGFVGYAATTAAGVLFLGLAFVHTLPALMALSFARSGLVAVFGIIWETAIGDSVDPAVRGRVLSLDMLGSFVLLPVAMAGTGVLTEAVGARWTFGVGGALWALVGAAGLLVPAAHRFRKA